MTHKVRSPWALVQKFAGQADGHIIKDYKSGDEMPLYDALQSGHPRAVHMWEEIKKTPPALTQIAHEIFQQENPQTLPPAQKTNLQTYEEMMVKLGYIRGVA